jgi:squalene-hopene/tetraprenyl-beta-curcumene cyclase
MDAYFERERDSKFNFMKSDFDITVEEILSSSASSTTGEISPPTSPILTPASPSLLTLATNSLSLAANYAWGERHEDGHWHGELQSNATVTAEHIFFLQSLSIPLSTESSHAFKKWLLSEQTPDGSWTLAPGHPGDVSVTVEAYLALKILGLSPSDPAMVRAKNFVLERGGMRSVRVLTRFFMAMFGLFPWDAVPQTPAELMLLPSYFPVNIYKLSSWARSNVVPLVIIRHHEPIFPLPNGMREGNSWLDELWVDPTDKMVPYGTSFQEARKEGKWFGWASTLVDTAVWGLGALVKKNPLRGYSLRVAKEWILERQEKEGDWAGIVPPMHQGMQALFLCGYKIDDPVMVKGIEDICMGGCGWEEDSELFESGLGYAVYDQGD